MRPTTWPRWLVWVLLGVVGLVYELREVRAGDEGFPLSRGLRWLFRTDTALGAAVFTLVVERGSVWLVRHIIDGSSVSDLRQRDSARAVLVRNGEDVDATRCHAMTRIAAGQEAVR